MNFTRFFVSCKDKFVEHSPEIMMAAGVVTFVGTIITACKATTKVSQIIDSHKEQMNAANALYENPVIDDDEIEYTISDLRKDKAIIFAQTSVELIKLYGPSAILGGLTITLFFGAFSIVHKRYVAASILAAGLSDTLSKYRGRVIEELGKEMDDHFLNGTVRDTVSVYEDDGEGNVKKSKDKIQTLVDPNGIPIYAKFFDESNPNWSESPSTSLMFLMGQQARANDLFKIRGKLLLNDVYSLLGLEQTEIGGMVGWFETHGDQFIDFGLYDGSERRRAFVNGYERNVLLNFNCVPKLPGDFKYA